MTTSPQPVAEQVAAAVLGVPGVVSLHGGSFGEVASYLPGRKVVGVRERPDGTHVHVVLRAGADLAVTADAVRVAVRRVVDGSVHLTVADIEP